MDVEQLVAAAVVTAALAGGAALCLRGLPAVRWVRLAVFSLGVLVVDVAVLEPSLSTDAGFTPGVRLAVATVVVSLAAMGSELRQAESASVRAIGTWGLLSTLLLVLDPGVARLAAGVAWAGVVVSLALVIRSAVTEHRHSLLDARLRIAGVGLGALLVGSLEGLDPTLLHPLVELVALVGGIVLWVATAPPRWLQLTLSPTREVVRAVDRELARVGAPDRDLEELLDRVRAMFGARAVVLTDGRRSLAHVGTAGDVGAADLVVAALEDRQDDDGNHVFVASQDRWVLAGDTGRGWLAVVLDEFGLVLGDTERDRIASLAERVGLALDRGAAQRRDRQAAASLRAADRMRDDFLATLSHELRTPLTSIRGFSEVLLEHAGRLPDTQRLDLQQRVVAKAAQLEQMIGGLLELTAVRGRSQPERIAVYELHDLCQRAVGRCRGALDGHTVEVHVPEGEVQTDGGALLTVLDHLLSNAGKFTPPGTTIQVLGRLAEDEVELVVSDDGPGLAELESDVVFDPFVRGGDVLTRETRGVGIGLTIARELAGQLGGTLRVVPSLAGSSFSLLVPRHHAQSDHVLAGPARRSADQAEDDPTLTPYVPGGAATTTRTPATR